MGGARGPAEDDVRERLLLLRRAGRGQPRRPPPQPPLVVALGYGVIGGIGLGLGYIAPVSTLVKWFPDRPGMATGLAIMGFGSGALVGAPFGVELMNHFKTAASVGVEETFLVMAACYFVMMNFAAWIVRVPAPAGSPRASCRRPRPGSSSRRHQVTADEAIKTPQFYLLWGVLCCNVTAGIGILAQASPMCQDMFGVTPVVAGGFVGLLSIFNMLGRFLWSSASDFTGRKAIYCVYFLLGCALYCLIPSARGSAAWRSSSRSPASSSRCTGPDSRPSPPTCATSSGPCRSARSTAASSRPGPWPRSSGRSS
jgi:MFS family permease